MTEHKVEKAPLISTPAEQFSIYKKSGCLLGAGCVAALILIGTINSAGHFRQPLTEHTAEDSVIESHKVITSLDLQDAANMLPYLSTISVSPDVTESPNILFVYVDDMGDNDIGYSSKDLGDATPALSALANDGVRFSRYYTMSSCTPARASFLTGMYAANVGMGYDGAGSFTVYSMYGMDNVVTIGDAFQNSGYETHMVGKWNVGHARERYWAHKRGFDTFYGYNGDEEKYYSHKAYKTDGEFLCDLAEANSSKSDTETGKTGIFVGDCYTGEYSTDLYADRIKTLIKSSAEADVTSPFFIYFASQAVHAPLELPPNATESLSESQLTMLKSVQDGNHFGDDSYKRYVFALMLIHLDKKVQEIVDTMYEYGKLSNSIIVVTSDNGGCPQDGGSNWPLRGTKFSSYEGGVKVPALFWSSRIATASRNRLYTKVFHVSDWLPTLLDSSHSLTELRDLEESIDGVSHWGGIAGYSNTVPRVNTLLHMNAWRKSTAVEPRSSEEKWRLENRNFTQSLGAILHYDWKLIMNTKSQGWYPVDGNYSDGKCLAGSHVDYGKRYLFNITDDPYEENELSEIHPEVVKKIEKILHGYYTKAIERGSNWLPSNMDVADEVYDEYGGFVVPFRGSATIYG